MKGKPLAFLVNLGITLATVLFCLAVAEVLVANLYSPPAGAHRLMTEYDPQLGWKKIPGVSGAHVTSEYEITEHINSRGIRGPEYSLNKMPSERRMVVLGDSFAEGYTVEFDELLSEVMEAELNSLNNGTHYEIINTGTGGYSTDQELIIFRTEGILYKPDLVILMFVLNDVWYNTQEKYWRGYKPLFRVGEEGLVLANTPVPPPDPTVGGATKRIVDWLTARSALSALTVGALRNAVHASETLRDVWDPVQGVPAEYGVFETSFHADMEQAWQMSAALIEALRDDVVATGGDLLVFYVPPQESIYEQEWEAMKRAYAPSSQRWNVLRPAEELKKICDSLGIDYLDPTDAFRHRARNPQERLYFKIDRHWTAQGHRLAGEVLAEYVTERYVHRWATKRQP